MLFLSHARRFALGRLFRGGPPANSRKAKRRDRHGLHPAGAVFAPAAVALAFGCSPAAPPPQTPEETAAANSEAASEQTEAPRSEPLPTPPAEPQSTAPTPAEPSPARTPRDTRGKEEIQQVMASNRDKVRACYDAVLAHNPGIAGDLVVDFTIDPRGDVKQAEVNWSQSEIHIPELDTCAADAVRALRFPPSSRGLESKVSYPFNFNPSGPKAPGQTTPGQASPGQDSPGQSPPGRNPPSTKP